MSHFILSRLFALVPVLLGVAVVVFAMLHLTPGDPARAILGDRPASAETLERLRRELRLDEPLPRQFVAFVGSAARGDLGTSYFTRRPVTTEIRERLPVTVRLMVGAMLVALLTGVPAGVLAATRPGTLLDYGVMAFATLGVSLPGFWLGLMLILVFAVNLGWLPVAGFSGPQYFVLPALALGASAAAVIARLTRSSLLEVLSLDYVRTAQAKGLNNTKVVFKHALRNALVPVVTVIGLQVGSLLAGSVIIETVFALPGLGRLIVQGIASRDYPLVQGITLFAALSYVLINFLVDLLYGFINPRIRYG